MGFYHEQSRPDRDQNDTILKDNVLRGKYENRQVSYSSTALGGARLSG